MTHTTKHTPGPWAVNDTTEDDDDTPLTICAPLSEVEIATMSAYENSCESFSEIRDNAHLIAAAPAMYAALTAIIGTLEALYADSVAQGWYSGDEQAEARRKIQAIEKALAQADGE